MKNKSTFTLAALSLLVLSCPVAALAETDGARLFAADDTNAVDPAAGAAWFVRSRPIRLDPGFLSRLQVGNRDGLGDVTIELFDGKTLRPVVTYYEAGNLGGYAWSGKLEGEDHGSFTISVYDDAMVAEFRSPERGVYNIGYAGNGLHFLREADRTKSGQCGACLVPPKNLAVRATQRAEEKLTSPPPPESPPQEGGAVTIDVLVVYTPSALVYANTVGGIAAAINYVIADTNLLLFSQPRGPPRTPRRASGSCLYRDGKSPNRSWSADGG